MTDAERRREMNRQIIEEFRANEGRVGGPFEGVPLALLHSRGAKTGEERINPLGCLDFEGTLYVFASNGGRAEHPGWYYNVQADPHVTVEFGTDTFTATARVLERAERQRIWEEQVRRFPAFGDYQDKVDRVIPVVALER
jgi:deazaflavin-dependent oxidoreductase (nitroreductase family)